VPRPWRGNILSLISRRCGAVINGITCRFVLVESAMRLKRPSIACARVIRRTGSGSGGRGRSENTAERRCMGSEIAQKKSKNEEADPEMTCGINDGTCKCPRAHNEPFHCPRGHVVAMGRGKTKMWKMRNME
jgi:hypothetical protein